MENQKIKTSWKSIVPLIIAAAKNGNGENVYEKSLLKMAVDADKFHELNDFIEKLNEK